MTTAQPDRLDRIEQILDTLAANQVQERDRRLELRDEFREDVEILFQTVKQTSEAVTQLTGKLDTLTVKVDILTGDVSQLTADVGNLATQADTDRATFRSTVLELLQVLTQQQNGNGHGGRSDEG